MVYLNGRMLPAPAARIAVNDAAVVMGATVTDFVRTFRQRLFRLDDHLERFYRSGRAVGIEMPVQPATLASVCRRLIRRHAGLMPAGKELALVMFASPGELAAYAAVPRRPVRKMRPTLCVHTFPLPLPAWRAAMKRGARLVVPSIRQVPPECVDPAVKCRSRMHWWLAEREARARDPLAMALCLDRRGLITETARANFALVRRGAVITPRRTGVLPGISLRIAGELCREAGIPFREGNLKMDDMPAADEALLTGTTFCIAPVTSINGRAIGNGRPGPVFQCLLAAWSRKVGVDIRAQIMEH